MLIRCDYFQLTFSGETSVVPLQDTAPEAAALSVPAVQDNAPESDTNTQAVCSGSESKKVVESSCQRVKNNLSLLITYSQIPMLVW